MSKKLKVMIVQESNEYSLHTIKFLENYGFDVVTVAKDGSKVIEFIKINNPDDEGVGEIFVKGKNVMAGYYNDPEATAAAFDGEWFKTGDHGRIDEDGFLFMVGRKKNLICLSNGKNVSPEELEDKLSRIDYVNEVLVYEEDKKIVAEFFLNEEDYPDARSRIKADIDAFNRKMPLFKNIGKFKVRDDEFPKTTTLKIARKYND